MVASADDARAIAGRGRRIARSSAVGSGCVGRDRRRRVTACHLETEPPRNRVARGSGNGRRCFAKRTTRHGRSGDAAGLGDFRPLGFPFACRSASPGTLRHRRSCGCPWSVGTAPDGTRFRNESGENRPPAGGCDRFATAAETTVTRRVTQPSASSGWAGRFLQSPRVAHPVAVRTQTTAAATPVAMAMRRSANCCRDRPPCGGGTGRHRGLL